VVHPVHGVGTVKSIKPMRSTGEHEQSYYEVVTGGPTVWVPVQAEGPNRLREVSSKATLAKCRTLLTSPPVRLDKNHRIRQLEIAARLKDGSMPAWCEMIRDLRARSWGTALGVADEVLLKRISKVLSEEWAASEGVSILRALSEIEDLLKQGRHSWEVEASARKRAGDALTNW
jgi:RNA polymerase-interacting CarD/CdnL/TRCF family regulator